MVSPVNNMADAPSNASDFPFAQIVPEPSVYATFRRWLWIPLLGLALALGLMLYNSQYDARHAITVTFHNGHGIKAGDTVRYRGATIGKVLAVALDDSLTKVVIRIALEPQARALARVGSRFWIERPQFSFSRIAGLDTLVGDKYIGILPGPVHAELSRTFEGLEEAPLLKEASPFEITLHFENGHWLQVGDPLLYRDIAVGEVTQVLLNPDLTAVIVKVRLVANAQSLARQGSVFWIERPQFSLSELSGLETVVKGRHVAVLPGPANGPTQHQFRGLDKRPSMIERTAGGLEIVLESEQRGSLKEGAVVYYRGFEIGRVASVALTSDTAAIEATVYIQPDYRALIRTNTHFWGRSGVEIDINWTNVRLMVESLTDLSLGGVHVGVPDPTGQPVSDGHRFTLHTRPEPEWYRWKPAITLESNTLATAPQPFEWLNATAQWQERTYFGISKAVNRSIRFIRLNDQRLLGPLLTTLQATAEQRQLTVTIDQQEYRLPETALIPHTLFYQLPVEPTFIRPPVASPPVIRVAQNAEDIFIINGTDTPLAVSAGRIKTQNRLWEWEGTFALNPAQWEGAAVIARRDGALLGIFSMLNQKNCIHLMTDHELTQAPIELLPTISVTKTPVINSSSKTP